MPRKRKGERAKVWELKTKPELLHPVLASRHEQMAKSIKESFMTIDEVLTIDEVYEKVAKILDREGIIGQARLLYRSYAEELWKLAGKYSGQTLRNQAGAVYSTYFRYGLDAPTLKEIALEIALLFNIEIPLVGLDYCVLG